MNLLCDQNCPTGALISLPESPPPSSRGYSVHRRSVEHICVAGLYVGYFLWRLSLQILLHLKQTQQIYLDNEKLGSGPEDSQRRSACFSSNKWRVLYTTCSSSGRRSNTIAGHGMFCPNLVAFPNRLTLI